MVLRPAEIAVIILTFSEYSIQPFQQTLGLTEMNETDKRLIIKLVSLLALGKLARNMRLRNHFISIISQA